MDSRPDAVAYHDHLAAGWESRYGRGGFARRARFIDEAVFPSLPPGGRWLDAGCGTGTFSRLLAAGGRDVVGVDASTNMVAEAKNQSAGTAADRLTFNRIGTIEQLPFESGSFEGVICFSVLEYLERPSEALSELARVVRPSGTLACSVPHRHSALRSVQRLVRGMRAEGGRLGYLALSRFATTPSEMEQSLAQHGFAMRKSIGFDPLLPSSLYPVLKPSLLYLIFEKAP